MPKLCRDCRRPIFTPQWMHVCDLITVTGPIPRHVHASRVDDYDGDVRKEIEQGRTKVINRWIKGDKK